MLRAITTLRLDEASDWVAVLACGHEQHMRHHPPLVSRPWVLTEQGRSSMIGTEVDCARCDRRELPAGYAPYRRTSVFDAVSVPAALLRSHALKPGVWALLHVTSGRLRYHMEQPTPATVELEAGATAVVAPEARHHVEPVGAVEFFLELYGRREPT